VAAISPLMHGFVEGQEAFDVPLAQMLGNRLFVARRCIGGVPQCSGPTFAIGQTIPSIQVLHTVDTASPRHFDFAVDQSATIAAADCYSVCGPKRVRLRLSRSTLLRFPKTQTIFAPDAAVNRGQDPRLRQSRRNHCERCDHASLVVLHDRQQAEGGGRNPFEEACRSVILSLLPRMHRRLRNHE
jgi:hypothetical protein